MITLDVRTVILYTTLIDILSLIVIIVLWSQYRKHFKGISFWVVDYVLQMVALLLIFLRGTIPDFISLIFPNSLVVGGTFILYLGLERFLGKRSSQLHNYIILAIFLFIQIYFTVVQPNLFARNINLNAGLFILCFQCVWLLSYRANIEARKMSTVAIIAFSGICLASLARIGNEIIMPSLNNDFFKSGVVETFLLILQQLFFVFLTFGLMLKLTRRLNAETRKSEALLKEAQSVARIGHWELENIRGKPSWSEEIYHILGLNPADGEPSFENHRDIIHTDDLKKFKDMVVAAFNENKPFDIEFRFIRADRSTGWMHIIGRTILERNGAVVRVFGTAQDITERKQLAEQLQKAEKLESVGLLAGGIAHDFNNMLTAILGNISLARMKSKAGDIDVFLNEAEKASLRAKDLTKQLITFAKGGMPIKKVGAISGLVKETTINALRGTNVYCRFFIADGIWLADIDEGQMTHVIRNLVINGQQAMPNGGSMEVNVENISISEQTNRDKKVLLNQGNYIRIAVVDHGVGIPAEDIDKIFDPYFTTKATGTGLGLATCYSIVKNHGGYITVESEVNSGSTFSIYLPAIVGKTNLGGNSLSRNSI